MRGTGSDVSSQVPNSGADAGRGSALALVGADSFVPLVTGNQVRHVNLDYAASTPALLAVRDAVNEFLPWYSSVHRGTGYKSRVASVAYEDARAAVAAFVRARPGDVVIFTRNTTDSINLLAHSLPASAGVVMFMSEHHANLLPWRRRGITFHQLQVPRSSSEVLEVLDTFLRRHTVDLVAITAASNVTGEVWPVKEVVRLCHERSARVFVDAAQLAPHAPISLCDLDADYIAFSGHKLYAPFGCGALIGRRDWLQEQEPFLRGGGAVDFVTGDDVLWTSLPARQEAGSPNVVGAIALGTACRVLDTYGMRNIETEEAELARYAEERLGSIAGLRQYDLWQGARRLGILTFNLQNVRHSLLAAALSAEYGISVRHGCFCAHPLLASLLGVDDQTSHHLRTQVKDGVKAALPGAVRMSMGLATTCDDIESLTSAITEISEAGLRWQYRLDPASGDFEADPDPRGWPQLHRQ